MDKLVGLVKRLVESNGHQWQLEENQIVLPVGAKGRQQKIYFSRDGSEYVFTTVVVGRALVTKRVDKWRELAKLVWHRNAEHEIVTFAFDRTDRLIGQVRHPAEHLEYADLEIYLKNLAREGDRFEYLLSGRDIF